MGVADSDVTEEIIPALCLQYTDLYNITILHSIYLSTEMEKLFTSFKKTSYGGSHV